MAPAWRAWSHAAPQGLVQYLCRYVTIAMSEGRIVDVVQKRYVVYVHNSLLMICGNSPHNYSEIWMYGGLHLQVSIPSNAVLLIDGLQVTIESTTAGYVQI